MPYHATIYHIMSGEIVICHGMLEYGMAGIDDGFMGVSDWEVWVRMRAAEG